MNFGDLLNKFAQPKRIPRLFALLLAVFMLFAFIIPITYEIDQIYTRPEPQLQIEEANPLAPYSRGGTPLVEPGITEAEYPENSKSIGMVNSYLNPVSLQLIKLSPYFGTSIYSSPGGLIDEILYYTRGFDTILESSILMMSFIIATWLITNLTTRPREEDE